MNATLDERKRRFFQTLAVAWVSYVIAIPFVYFLVLKIFGLGKLVAGLSLAIGLLATAPALVVSTLRGYRAVRTGRDGRQPAQTTPGWLALRTGMGLGGAILAAVGAILVVEGQEWHGAILALAGASLVAFLAVSMGRPSKGMDAE